MKRAILLFVISVSLVLSGCEVDPAFNQRGVFAHRYEITLLDDSIISVQADTCDSKPVSASETSGAFVGPAGVGGFQSGTDIAAIHVRCFDLPSAGIDAEVFSGIAKQVILSDDR